MNTQVKKENSERVAYCTASLKVPNESFSTRAESAVPRNLEDAKLARP